MTDMEREAILRHMHLTADFRNKPHFAVTVSDNASAMLQSAAAKYIEMCDADANSVQKLKDATKEMKEPGDWLCLISKFSHKPNGVPSLPDRTNV